MEDDTCVSLLVSVPICSFRKGYAREYLETEEPIWVDHVGSKGTVWQQFSLHEAALQQPEEDDPRWIAIRNKT